MRRFRTLIVASAWTVAIAVVFGCIFVLWLGTYGLGEDGRYGFSVLEVAGIVAAAAGAANAISKRLPR